MSLLLSALIMASAALSVNDVSACDQWALHNNGAFYFEEEKERYYMNGDQIQISQGPGVWADKSLYEVRLEKERKNAVGGIDINIDEAWTQYGTGNREVCRFLHSAHEERIPHLLFAQLSRHSGIDNRSVFIKSRLKFCIVILEFNAKARA